LKISVIAVCKNEERMLPWFLRHYAFADEIHIHDNGSTDGSLGIMAANPKVSVSNLITEGLDDGVIVAVKNCYYKTLDSDWFIIVDIDEFVFIREYGGKPCDIRRYLEMCQAGDITLPQVSGYQMVGNGWPEDDGKSLLVDICKIGAPDAFFSKRVVVQKRVNINYEVGCHRCNPTGFVVHSNDISLKLLHYHWLDEGWRKKRFDEACRNHSRWNIENLGITPERICAERKLHIDTLARYRKEARNIVD